MRMWVERLGSSFLGSPIRFVVILVFMAVVCSSANADNALGVPDSEYNALVALYNSTDGPNWTDNTNWLTSDPGWYGVTVSGGHVTQLDIHYNQLSGMIPPELGNLTNLQSLSLSYNYLTGTIPPEMGNLTYLQGLWLSDNQLTGKIPLELSNLTNLQYLVLGFNCLTDTIPPELGNLTYLQELWLGNNQLSGPIPPELGNLTSLVLLDLHSNPLIGTIPPELGNLINLQELWLCYNQLTGIIPPELGNLTNLWSLDLGGNMLSGTIPPELGNLTNLRILWLPGNWLTGTIPQEFGNLTNLEHLWLLGNQLTGTIPPELGNLTNLWSLRLDANWLTGTIPPELGNLTNLRELSLSGTLLTGTIPPELGNLINLCDLWLDSNRFSGTIPPELGNLTNLCTLRLDYNCLTGTIPSSLINLTSFTWGCISYNGLWASDPTLVSFLNNYFGDWESTQTIPPVAMSASTTSPEETQVSWTPILYTGDAGYYEVGYSQTSGGQYTPCGQTADKLASSITISDLPTDPLCFAIRTVTLPNINKNTVTSLWSAEVSEILGLSKTGPDGLVVNITNAVVTAAFSGCIYVESLNRSCGIRVDYNWLTAPSGCVNINGTLGTLASGERYIEASSVSPTGTGSVTPFALINKSLGGGDWHYDPITGDGQCGVTGAFGLNNIGLLVRTCGRFNYIDSHTFMIDDGSGVNVKCVVPEEVVLNQSWSYVGVTGISSCEMAGDELHRLLLVRTQDDITIY